MSAEMMVLDVIVAALRGAAARAIVAKARRLGRRRNCERLAALAIQLRRMCAERGAGMGGLASRAAVLVLAMRLSCPRALVQGWLPANRGYYTPRAGESSLRG